MTSKDYCGSSGLRVSGLGGDDHDQVVQPRRGLQSECAGFHVHHGDRAS